MVMWGLFHGPIFRNVFEVLWGAGVVQQGLTVCKVGDVSSSELYLVREGVICVRAGGVHTGPNLAVGVCHGQEMKCPTMPDTCHQISVVTAVGGISSRVCYLALYFDSRRG